jgi:hypothetical protein
LITITVRIITVDKTIAIIINTAGAAGFGWWWPATVLWTVARVIISVAEPIAAIRCKPTVYFAIAFIFITFAHAVTAAPAYCTIRAEFLIIFIRMADAITIILEAVCTASTSATRTIYAIIAGSAVLAVVARSITAQWYACICISVYRHLIILCYNISMLSNHFFWPARSRY